MQNNINLIINNIIKINAVWSSNITQKYLKCYGKQWKVIFKLALKCYKITFQGFYNSRKE